MAAYYNEFDENAAAWLRELIRRGLIAPGDVDTRSIVDVRPDDLAGYTQCHFFAGIGVWSHALRRAEWPDDRPAWTGSPPCQPFSAAGKGDGVADPRHLWPHFFHLIDVCRPENLFGEQVASKDGLAWLDAVFADMEGAGYAFGAFDLCAAGFGAPHIRQRLYLCGTRALVDPLGARLEGHGWHGDDRHQSGWLGAVQGRPVAALGADGGLSLPDDSFWRANLSRGDFDDGADAGRPQGAGDAGTGFAGSGLADAARGGRAERLADDGETRHKLHEPRGCPAGGLGNALGGGRQPQPSILREHEDRVGQGERQQVACVQAGGDFLDGTRRPGPTNGLWGDVDWLLCRDGKWRPVEPGTFPLAHGAAARVGRLRGYGNAIVAQVAEGFIASFLDAEAGGFRSERQPESRAIHGAGGLISADILSLLV